MVSVDWVYVSALCFRPQIQNQIRTSYQYYHNLKERELGSDGEEFDDTVLSDPWTGGNLAVELQAINGPHRG